MYVYLIDNEVSPESNEGLQSWVEVIVREESDVLSHISTGPHTTTCSVHNTLISTNISHYITCAHIQYESKKNWTQVTLLAKLLTQSNS